MEWQDWPLGTPDERYKRRRAHAEECLRLNISLAHSAWEASAQQVISINHLDHPCCPVPPSFELRDHGEFVVGLAHSLTTFLSMALEAYAGYLIETAVPTVEAIDKLNVHAASLIEETRRAKWLTMLAEANLDAAPRMAGWEVDFVDVFQRETVSATGRTLQAMIDEILAEPEDSDLLCDEPASEPENHGAFDEVKHRQYMTLLDIWRREHLVDGKKLTYDDIAKHHIKMNPREFQRVRRQPGKLRVKGDLGRLYEFIDRKCKT